MKQETEEKRWARYVMYANIGLVLFTGLGLVGGFWVYTEGKFATKEALASEVSARQDDKKEIKETLKQILGILLKR